MARVIFEQPLSEALRLCLRLEKLFHQFDQAVASREEAYSRFAMDSLIEILRVSDRPDLKSKLSQALSAQVVKFNQWSRNPQVDGNKLQGLIEEFEGFISILNDRYSKVASELRDHPLIQSISHHAMSPGGACDHNVPMYQLWLNQDEAVKLACFDHWLVHLSDLKKMVLTLLRVIRGAQPFESHYADRGFFQTPLQNACSLIRVSVDASLNCYAMTSVGKHRLSVTFYDLVDVSGPIESQKSENNIKFKLACCY